ncbi:hypothetical protein Tco_0658006 [Tanacetum coccineum]
MNSMVNSLSFWDYSQQLTATTPIESNKPLVKDEDGKDVDVHVYRSMIGSLMYLTASRPDIMFAVCTWARFQVTPKASHSNAVKRFLEDAEGISSLSNEEIFEHLAHMGSKKTAWDQFSSNIATALICLATSMRFNFSKFIFEAMVKNLDSPHKFLLYPSKLFSNMRRASKGYLGVVTPLFENMLVQAHDEEQQQSPSRITSSPSLSPQPTQPSPLPEPIQPTHEAEETAFMPHDSPLHDVHSHGSAKGSVQQHDLTVLVTKLNDKINGLEKDFQQTKRKAKIVLSDDEEIAEDSSKQGRKISQINKDPTISLVQDEGISWIPQEEEVHEKPSDETEVLVQEETPTEIIEEHGSGKKCEMEISTANIQVSTASPPKVSTVVPHVYTRRSAKDKGKAIMEEPATPKKEAARELQRQLDQRHEVPTQPTQSHRIDWNDLSVLRYHALKNRPVSIAKARRNMITYLKNQGGYKESYFKKMSYDDIRPIFERWDHLLELGRKTLARRRASDKQGQDSSKRQKKEKETTDYEDEKDELRMWLTVVPG